MDKEPFYVKIPKELDEEFRSVVSAQGKQLNLSIEEAMKIWLEEEKKKEKKKNKKK